jgi:hypothetical protein
MTQNKRKCKLAAKEHEICRIIAEAESTIPSDYEYYMTESSEDLRHLAKVSKRGVVNIELP